MTERTSVNGAPCVRDQAGNEWYATDEGGLFVDGEVSDYELRGEDLRWLLEASSESAAQPSEQGWVAFDAADDARCPISGNPVQFVTHNGASVGRREDDGKWWDFLNIGADGTPNEDYRDEQVTHWAPLLPSPPKAGQ